MYISIFTYNINVYKYINITHEYIHVYILIYAQPMNIYMYIGILIYSSNKLSILIYSSNKICIYNLNCKYK